MRRLLPILLVAALVVVAGCGGGSSSSTTSSTKNGQSSSSSGSKGASSKGNGSGGGGGKVIPPLAVMFKADHVKSPSKADISKYGSALLKAQKACAKTAKLHLANLATFVHTHTAKYHVKVSALEGLNGASFDTKEPDCTKRFQAYAQAKIKHGQKSSGSKSKSKSKKG